jgi:flagellar biosynthesis anti-sigma factor FlgM
MRIGLNNAPDTQALSAEQAKKSSSSATNQAKTSGAVNQAPLSEDTVTLSALSTQALSQPEVRQGLVDSLKQSVSSGQYKLDPKAIADAILGR